MLCDKTFKIFHVYFGTAYSFGFFKWNNKGRNFCINNVTNDRQFKIWQLSNIILLFKVIFLAVQVYDSIKTGQTSKTIFENSFMITNIAALLHNFLCWNKGNGVPVLYWRCVTFSNTACGKFLKRIVLILKFNFLFKIAMFSKSTAKFLGRQNQRYPLDNDGLSGMMKEGICINFLLSFCVFALSFSDPLFPLFFANWFPLGSM